MMRYLLGFLKNLLRRGISPLALVDTRSRISRKARLYRFAKIVGSEIGDFSYVGPNSWVVDAEIGKFCSIAPNCKIGLAEHTTHFLSTSPIFTEARNGTGFSWTARNIVSPSKRVRVGNDVWIGERTLVLGGISIGNGAVIGAGAIVTKDVPACAIAAGVPAKIVRYRFDAETIARLEKSAWWNLPEKELRAHIAAFQTEDFRGSKILATPPRYSHELIFRRSRAGALPRPAAGERSAA